MENTIPGNIRAMHLDETVIQGVNVQGFLNEDENSDRWKIGILYYEHNLLKIQVTNTNVQMKDGFFSHFVIVGGDTLVSHASNWFVVKDCPRDIPCHQSALAESAFAQEIVTTCLLHVAGDMEENNYNTLKTSVIDVAEKIQNCNEQIADTLNYSKSQMEILLSSFNCCCYRDLDNCPSFWLVLHCIVAGIKET